MSWKLQHHFANDSCRWGQPLVRDGLLGRPQKEIRQCPQAEGSDVASRLTDAVASLLSRRGYDHPPSGDSNSLLWCLGGPSLYRIEEDRESVSADDCLDLNLVVCDAHKAISLELYPYDLVPERGGSGPDDPLRSEPIKLDDEQDIVGQVMVRVEPWLDSIVTLPDRR